MKRIKKFISNNKNLIAIFLILALLLTITVYTSSAKYIKNQQIDVKLTIIGKEKETEKVERNICKVI